VVALSAHRVRQGARRVGSERDLDRDLLRRQHGRKRGRALAANPRIVSSGGCRSPAVEGVLIVNGFQRRRTARADQLRPRSGLGGVKEIAEFRRAETAGIAAIASVLRSQVF
jgi:hypothetical protein